jgi:hypothetical protein
MCPINKIWCLLLLSINLGVSLSLSFVVCVHGEIVNYCICEVLVDLSHALSM